MQILKKIRLSKLVNLYRTTDSCAKRKYIILNRYDLTTNFSFSSTETRHRITVYIYK